MQASPIPTSQTGGSLAAVDSAVILLQEAKYFATLLHDAAAKGKASDIESLVVVGGRWWLRRRRSRQVSAFCPRSNWLGNQSFILGHEKRARGVRRLARGCWCNVSEDPRLGCICSDRINAHHAMPRSIPLR
jgi:hypothetical protein